MRHSKLIYYLRQGELPAQITDAAADAATAVLWAFQIDPKKAQWCAGRRENGAGFPETVPAGVGGDSARALESREFGAQAWDIARQAADEVADVFGFGPGELTNYPDDAGKARAEWAARH